MHTRGHHLHTRLQARGNHRLITIRGTDLHRLQLDGATGRVIKPHRRALTLASPSWRKAVVGSLMTCAPTASLPAPMLRV